MKNSIRFTFAVIVSLFIISCKVQDHKLPETNNIRNYLVQKATEITDNSLSGIVTLNDWQKIRNRRYDEFTEMMGLPSKDYRPSLNVKVTGTIQEKGYHIEKLYYESLPGMFVRANLYVPDNNEKPMPAILYVCGHSPTQKVHYQAHPRKFAQLGFVCLIIETIQFGEVRGEHWGCYANGWFNWYSRGYNPGGVELWNAIRGLDLLSSTPEVDPENIGVTGISGGGSQSWYIAAADPRVKAVAPVCGASTLKAQIATRTIDGHCDCMMPINTLGQDFADLGALIAPRPLLICQADRDGLNKIESVRVLYERIREIYKLYNASDKIGLIETPGGHSYHKISREGIFFFFMEHLMNKRLSPEEAGDIDESEQSQLSDEQLKVYIDGVPADDKTTIIQDSFIKLAVAPVISDEQELLAFRDSVKTFLKTRTFGAFPQMKSSLDTILEFRALDGGRYGEDIYSFVPETGWRLKIDIHWAHKPDSMNPMLIILRNYNEARWESESFADKIAHDQNIAFLEVRGVGESGWEPELQWHVRRASAWTGRTIASMRVYDLMRCLEFCRSLPGVDPGKLSIAARDEMTVVALYAALMDGNCKSLILKNPPETQDQAGSPDGKGSAIEMLNCLKITDIYQIPALVSPATVTFEGEVPAKYKWSGDILEKLGKGQFTIIN